MIKSPMLCRYKLYIFTRDEVEYSYRTFRCYVKKLIPHPIIVAVKPAHLKDAIGSSID